MLEFVILVFLHCGRELAAAQTTEECSTHQFNHPFYQGESCKEIYDRNPQAHNMSGYYWLINPFRHAYCDMEQRAECGNIGGWTRIANVDVSRGDACPTGWTSGIRNGVSFCRTPNDRAGCYPTLFSSNQISYQKVCGMARGYQKGAPDAFRYGGLDGLSITHGNPRQHIWTYAVGITYEAVVSSCPCAHSSNPQPNSFIGSNFYCDTGTTVYPNPIWYFEDNPLWDGIGCTADAAACCTIPHLPWFYRELNIATMDDVEMRICSDEAFPDEALLVDQLELYIQ